MEQSPSLTKEAQFSRKKLELDDLFDSDDEMQPEKLIYFEEEAN